jgi:hypothetical protein
MGMKDSLAQAGAVQDLGALPLIVLSRGARWGETEETWQRHQADLVLLSSAGQQLFAGDSGHGIQYEQPEAAISAIRQMVEQIRLEGDR